MFKRRLRRPGFRSDDSRRYAAAVGSVPLCSALKHCEADSFRSRSVPTGSPAKSRTRQNKTQHPRFSARRCSAYARRSPIRLHIGRFLSGLWAGRRLASEPTARHSGLTPSDFRAVLPLGLCRIPAFHRIKNAGETAASRLFSAAVPQIRIKEKRRRAASFSIYRPPIYTPSRITGQTLL